MPDDPAKRPLPARRPVLVRNRHARLRARATDVARLFQALDASGLFAAPAGALSIALLDAREMGELHARFFNDPSPTDVITFDGDALLGEAGEICVCADIARAYADEHGEKFSDELTLYLVHGYLHLAGFDDRRAPDRKRMRAAEQSALGVVRRADALPSFSLV